MASSENKNDNPHPLLYTHSLGAEYPWHVWSFQQGEAAKIDIINAFHDRSKTLNIIATHEKDIHRSMFPDRLKYDWDNTQVNIINAYHPTHYKSSVTQHSEHLKPTRHFFPMQWLYLTFVDLRITKRSFFWWTDQGVGTMTTKRCTKHFLTYNRRMRFHRAALIQKLYEEGLLQNNYYTLHEAPIGSEEVKFLNKYRVGKFIKSKKFSVPLNDFGDFEIHQDFFNHSNAYKDSAFQLVTETFEDCIFWSEKTFINILNQKPFVISGGQLSNMKLQEYGFKLYDDIFDYTFDTISDDIERLRMLSNEIKRVTETYTPQTIYKKCVETAKFNRNRAYEILTQELFIPEICHEWDKRWQDEWIWKRHTWRWWYDFKKVKTCFSWELS